MFEVTQENYHTFLTWHGLDPDCAATVVANHDNSDGYHTHLSVKLWVDASKIVLYNSNQNKPL